MPLRNRNQCDRILVKLTNGGVASRNVNVVIMGVGNELGNTCGATGKNYYSG